MTGTDIKQIAIMRMEWMTQWKMMSMRIGKKENDEEEDVFYAD